MKRLQERETHLSLANGFRENYIVTKVGYDELGTKLLKNVTHNLEVVDQRYSFRRAKILLPLQVVPEAAALEKLHEKFWRKQDSA